MRTHEDAIGYLAAPGEGRHPGVVVIPDVWGLSDHYRDIARRLAGEGFAALALDVYRKTGFRKLSDVSEAMAWIRELPDPVVVETMQEGVDHLAASEAAAGRRIGITGFCMGGQYALLAACSCRGLSACAPFYGMLRYEPDRDRARKPRDPLEALDDLTCPVLGFYGEEDAIIPVDDVRELERRLEAGPHEGAVVLYPGAGHAFMNDTRAQAYREDAARDAWARLVPFLRRHLAGDAR
jgi:carboxymethylenebutenolidase